MSDALTGDGAPRENDDLLRLPDGWVWCGCGDAYEVAAGYHLPDGSTECQNCAAVRFE